MNIQSNVSLANHSSWLVGGNADYFFEPTSVDELKEAQEWAQNKKISLTVLGGGTNVLISDHGVEGLVISLSKFTGISEKNEDQNLSFWALSGTTKSELLKIFLKYKLPAACFLAGLPGQVGGGVVMNAGVGEKLTPREFCEIIDAVEVLRPNGKLEIISNEKLKWDYRHCDGWQPGIITRVKISVPLTPDDQIISEVKKLNQARLSKQPLEYPSCGSVFRNPLPKTSGQLIESVGLKGHEIGGAQVSVKHANFIINKNKASAKDIWNLMELCVRRVKEVHNIELHSEVVLIGRPL